VAEFMQESIVFLLRVQCRRKESSRSLSHLLMSFLWTVGITRAYDDVKKVIHIYNCSMLYLK